MSWRIVCARLRESGRWPQIPVGINIGKSKVTPLEQAAEDYLYSFRRLAPFADYMVLNVSSPNTPGLRSLQEHEALSGLLSAIREENRRRENRFSSRSLPIFLRPIWRRSSRHVKQTKLLESLRQTPRSITAAIPAARDQTGGLERWAATRKID